MTGLDVNLVNEGFCFRMSKHLYLIFASGVEPSIHMTFRCLGELLLIGALALSGFVKHPPSAGSGRQATGGRQGGDREATGKRQETRHTDRAGRKLLCGGGDTEAHFPNPPPSLLGRRDGRGEFRVGVPDLPFLHKTKGPTRNPISPTPPPLPPSAGIHVTPPPPPPQSNFQVA